MPDAICLRAECGGWRILLDIELSTERLLGYEGAECRREFVLSRDHNAAELHLLRLVHQLAQRALQFDAYRTTRASARQRGNIIRAERVEDHNVAGVSVPGLSRDRYRNPMPAHVPLPTPKHADVGGGKLEHSSTFRHARPLPGIHVYSFQKPDVDGRVKPGHDELKNASQECTAHRRADRPCRRSGVRPRTHR